MRRGGGGKGDGVYPRPAGGDGTPYISSGIRLEGAVFVLILHHSVWGGTPYVSSAPTQGHPSPGRSTLSVLRCGERPCDTLRAHPENTARHLGWPSVRVEGRCRPKVTSGCPKRSEGGCPCRNEDEHHPSKSQSGGGQVPPTEPVSCRSCPAAHSREREPNAPRSAQPPASNQRQKQPQRYRCALPARAPPNRQCR